MRAVVAVLLIAMSLATLGFVVMKWLPVVWKDGVSEAYDQLISSNLNTIATALLIMVGIVSFGVGVFVAPERDNSRK